MGNILRWGFVACVAVFVCYHFWPMETTHTGKVAADKLTRAGKELTK